MTLALAVGNILGAEPVITTTTEALKTVIVGVGLPPGRFGPKNPGGGRGGPSGNRDR